MASASSENFFCFEQQDLLTKRLTKFQDFRKNGIFCDVVVKAGDQEFLAHRNVLAATIPYFYTMLTSEDMEIKHIELILKGIDASSLEALIDFSYNGKIQIDPRNVQKLMSAADCFNLNQVKNACADFLTSNIQADNVFEIKKFGNLLKCQQLVLAADKFINKNFSKISESNQFLKLDFEEIKKLIENDDKNCSEEIVFETAIKWVKHEEDERKSYLPEILSKIQLSLVSTKFLVNVVSTNHLIWSSFDCLRIVDKAKTYHLNQLENKFTQKSQDLPKLNNLAHTLHGTQIKLYDVTKNEWLRPVSLNKNRPGSTVVSLDSKIYVIGGSSNYERNVDIYDFETKLWSKGRDMINGRSEFGATTLNDCIYVCGGIQRSNYLSSVECYSVKEKNWKSVAPMNTKRSHFRVTPLNGFIYAIGGYNTDQQALDSCEKYDPTSNTWTIIKPLICKMCARGVATLNNKIYACGGYGNGGSSNSCEIYNPSTNTWSNIASMNKDRYLFSLKSFNGKLYAVGETNLSADMPLVEVYSPETNSWETLT